MSAQRRRAFLTGLLTGVVLTSVGALAVNAAFGPFGESANVASEVRQTIEENYYKQLGSKFLDTSSIDGMLKALRARYGDKFSHYFDAKAFAQFESSTSGRFQGIGLTVNGVKRGLRVVRVLPNTPAERAGIRRGDVIVAAAGHSLAGLSADAGASLIKGQPGTPVDLRLAPAAGGKVRSLTVKRADVRLPAAKGTMRSAGGRKVAYVRFATFSSGAHAELAQAIKRLYQRGAQGLVLDLRGNGGGLLNEAVLCSSLFLKEGQLIVSTRSRTQGDRSYDAVGGSLAPHTVVVLIDRDTASAAEILTSALADHGVATVVGTRSYGKGVFQDVITLGSGGALDLTIGRYFTADGISLAGKGIKPDVRARDNSKTKADEGLARALAVLSRKLSSAKQPG